MYNPSAIPLFARAFILGLLLCSPFIVNAQTVTPKRVVVLYWDNKDFPGNMRFDESFKAALKPGNLERIEYYPEYFEITRFPDETHISSFFQYLKEKYSGRNIDVVVASADAPLNFLLKHRGELFTNSALVYVALEQPPAELVNNVPATGIIHHSTHRETVELALNLHPGTKQVFVVSGTVERDKRFERVARRQLQPLTDKVEFTYLTDLPLNELLSRTTNLPPHSVILYLWQRTPDEQGVLLETFQVLRRVAPTASAPIYAMGTPSLGAGIVGGFLQGPERNGARAGELVDRILKGTKATDIPVERAPYVPTFDWRQLRRWGISEGSLPAGSAVEFKEFTFWELYKWRIIAVIALILLQTAFIAVLLIERRRRQRARNALDQLNAELEQRIATRTEALRAKSQELETFAYSVAHDLKAPLRGIDGYSRLLLEDHTKSLNEEGRFFVKTIQTSTGEMTQLIEDLLAYSRLDRREIKNDRIEIGPIVNAAVLQKRREVETTDREIEFVVEVNGGAVKADANGLSQALNNYIDNAIKFTRDVSHALIEIGSKETPEHLVVWVRDNGVGFDMKYHDRIFDIFQRLNRPEEYPGTGIGLAIVRKAMDRMGGKAWAESEEGRGATFFLEIPK